MIGKSIKYLRSMIRILIFKIIYRNKLKLKLRNVKSLYIGKCVRIKINKGNILSFGDNVYIDDYSSFECVEGSIYVEDNTFFNTNNKIVSLKKISIGSNCLFGPNVGIFDHDHKYDMNNLPINSQGYKIKEVDIGNDIWVGCNSTITRGVKICDKVVVAANSVVTKSIINSGIYGGVPSKFIKNI